MNGQYQPPHNDDGSNTQRILLAFALTFIVIFGSQWLITKYMKPAQQPARQQSQPVQSAPAAQPAQPPAPTTNAAPVAPAVKGSKQATAESETVLDGDFYRIVLTNRGGQVKSWVLKKYTDDKGNQLELVHQLAAQQYGYPLSLWTYDESLRSRLNNALYAVNESGDANNRTITFEYSDGTVAVRKSFRFALHPPQPPKNEKGALPNPRNYVVDVDIELTQGSTPIPTMIAWPAGFGDQTVSASYSSATIDWTLGEKSTFGGTKVDRLKIGKVSGGGTIQGPFNWGGVSDQYFAAIYLPDDPQTATLVQLRNSLNVPKNLDKPDPNQTMHVEVLGAAAGDRNGHTRGRLFVGPKALPALDSVHAVPLRGQSAAPDLEGLVDFGTYFGWLAKPLFLWLEWTETHWVANWGWAICILTLIINLAMLPLRLSQVKSMLKMQKVQPQIQAIRAKYKAMSMSDPRRRGEQQELMGLYKKEGVNPTGGCLPLLLQWPFLIAFYSMLGNTIELRHAAWLWIKDLSSPDPVYILPVLTIVGMFIVQKMTPQAGMDPAQQKMMSLVMPVFIGFITFSLASGLVLYWVVSNFVQIAQQWAINRTAFGREMRDEMARRAAKKRAKEAPPQKPTPALKPKDTVKK